LEPEHIIDETATIQGASIEKVYDICLQWIQSIPTHDLETTRPHTIQAYHKYQARTSAHVMFHHKKFILTISDQGNDITVHISIHKIQDNAFPPQQDKRDRYLLYWIDYVVNLWEHLGVDQNYDELKRLYPLDIIQKRMSERQNNYQVYGFMWLAISLLMVLIDDGSPVLYRMSLFVVGFIVSNGMLFMFYSVIPNSVSKILKIQQNPWILMRKLYRYKTEDNLLFRILSKMPL